MAGGKESTDIGGLQCPLENRDGVVLCCDIAQGLGSAAEDPLVPL